MFWLCDVVAVVIGHETSASSRVETTLQHWIAGLRPAGESASSRIAPCRKNENPISKENLRLARRHSVFRLAAEPGCPVSDGEARYQSSSADPASNCCGSPHPALPGRSTCR